MHSWMKASAWSLALHTMVFVVAPTTPPAVGAARIMDAHEMVVEWQPWAPTPIVDDGPAALAPTMSSVPLAPPTPIAPSLPAGSSLVEAVPDAPRNPPIAYPRDALVRQWEGRVLLEVLVLASGQCGDVKVHESSGHWILDREAATSVRQWRFRPAQRWGVPATCWAVLPVRFRLEDARISVPEL